MPRATDASSEPTLPMRVRTLLQALRLPARARRATLGAVLAGAAGLGAGACQNDVNVTDPNVRTSGTFWRTAADARAGVTATYNALLRLGTFQRWQAFAFDLRSDIGTSGSGWFELQQFVKFRFPSGYDFEVNRNLWDDLYTLVARANLVTTNVPAIEMDAAEKGRLVAEGKFLRGVAYFQLFNLYGSNIPLMTTPPAATDRPASSDTATVYAQLEKDFSEAAAALPVVSTADAAGRASRAAAQGMLGKVQLQQRKWAQAAATLQPIVAGQMGAYQLEPNYARLFTQAGNQNAETLFEVQMGNDDTCPQGICGLNVIRMIGPCGVGFCDGEPTRWYFNEFQQERTRTGGLDPRLDATIFYWKGDTTTIFNRTWTERYGTDTTRVFWKKYSEYYTAATEQTWEGRINYKILRFADVLLMYAEALNEQGQTAQAYEPVNVVRRRAQLADLAPGFSQAQMRAEILRQRYLEFGLEMQRWMDLGRHNLFTTDLATLRAHDGDFNQFTPGVSHVLAIPQRERNLNPNVRQNNGY